jgi:hypothetical protein
MEFMRWSDASGGKSQPTTQSGSKANSDEFDFEFED